MIGAPLVTGSQLIATLSVGRPEVRDWSESDVSLPAEVAERTWAAIQPA
ncbi:GAF domain-containing protein [Agrobacterium sp. S2]|nr:GAF domain-containing protein [Agrobacterium sp. S2]